jgi:RNA-directed DNA polymerase
LTQWQCVSDRAASISKLGLLRQGHTDVVDADLSKYFDTIPHDELMLSIARCIVDPGVLRLIKQWLKAPVETTDGNGKRRMEGGRASRHGTPQGVSSVRWWRTST